MLLQKARMTNLSRNNLPLEINVRSNPIQLVSFTIYKRLSFFVYILPSSTYQMNAFNLSIP